MIAPATLRLVFDEQAIRELWKESEEGETWDEYRESMRSDILTEVVDGADFCYRIEVVA